MMISLLLLFPLFVQSANVRDNADISHIVELMRVVAPTYETRDLVYTQKLVDLQRKRTSQKWRLVSKQYSVRLEHNGRVYWQPMKSPHDDATKPGHWRLADVGCNTDIFNELTHVSLKWLAWTDVRGHRSAVFEFSVPKKVRECNGRAGHKSIVISFSGTVDVDATSGYIWRIDMTLENEPPFPKCTETFEYDAVNVGSTQQPVQVSRVEETAFSEYEERTEWTFSNFRRFQVDSSISY